MDVLCIDNSLVKQKQLDRITWVRESRDKKMVKTLVFIITKINIRCLFELKPFLPVRTNEVFSWKKLV